MEMILNFLLLFDGMLALYSHDENLEITSKYGAKRQKRLIYGQIVLKEDQDYYPSTTYQSTLISAHYCNENLLNILQQLHLHNPGHWNLIENWKIQAKHVKDLIVAHCPIDKTRAYCGGAAITEFAIQTACHCIARFDSRTSVALAIPKVYNAWEDMIFMYVGAISFDKDNTPYVSKDFLTHQNCMLVANQTISHNLGIIILRYRLQQGTRIAAPMNMVEMKNQWHYVIGKQAVCLVVGWGSENYEGRDVYGLPSLELRKSWRVMRSFMYCYQIHKSISEFVFTIKANYITKTNYKDVQTWSCSTDFGKLRSGIGHGDSGSPVACVQGWYFGVANWGMTAYDQHDRPFTITTDTDLVYAFFENSWDYRPDFNKYIHDVRERSAYPNPYPSFSPNRQFAQMGKPGSDIASQSDSLRGDPSPSFLISFYILRYILHERKLH